MDKNFIPPGSDVSSGTFQCIYHSDIEIKVQSITSLPPCQKCVREKRTNLGWRNLSGVGDAKGDPYPRK